MPELPEVETVRKGLSECLAGRRIVHVTQRRPDLRIPFPDAFAPRIEGSRVRSVGRRAKYLLIELDNGSTLIAHLGMSGRFSFYDSDSVGRKPGSFHFNGASSSDGVVPR